MKSVIGYLGHPYLINTFLINDTQYAMFHSVVFNMPLLYEIMLYQFYDFNKMGVTSKFTQMLNKSTKLLLRESHYYTQTYIIVGIPFK